MVQYIVYRRLEKAYMSTEKMIIEYTCLSEKEGRNTGKQAQGLQDRSNQKEIKNTGPMKLTEHRTDTIINPNLADSLTLASKGFKPFVIRNLLKYRRAGGRIGSLNDLKKIYGIDTHHVNRLNSEFGFTLPVQPAVDINSADSTALCTLYGIGPVLSARIIRYRKTLGGFHDGLQLLEVYGISPDIFKKNKDRIVCSGTLQKLNINLTGKDSMARHPYFSWELSRAITNYRELNGDFDSVEQLKFIHLIKDSVYQKIKPYCHTGRNI